MINILGRSNRSGADLSLPAIAEPVHIHAKLYGKDKCSIGRKMGHVNIVDPSGQYDLRSIAQKLFTEYYI
jgi:phosphoribosylaminoimidazole carboxylase (NCAIR synthetase)